MAKRFRTIWCKPEHLERSLGDVRDNETVIAITQGSAVKPGDVVAIHKYPDSLQIVVERTDYSEMVKREKELAQRDRANSFPGDR